MNAAGAQQDGRPTTKAAGEDLPGEYHRPYRIWFVAGFPAFAGVLVILWLMVARPVGLFG